MLLIIIIEHVLTCTMMLYAEDTEMPLPTQEEVLICTSETTAEEVPYEKFIMQYHIKIGSQCESFII